jgi:hypothetical protein
MVFVSPESAIPLNLVGSPGILMAFLSYPNFLSQKWQQYQRLRLDCGQKYG